ncbi:MAG: sec-independent protein translocase protein TatB [Blastocatellia bacterium]|jgi:TatA/E family protein of Tat protein translocase|nr:sec-independent protein translocase protein TatB [Blastocatellia bacterium]
MFLLILDSLGNSELLVILAAALIFFGPRKLPQLSRTVGKSLTEFRRASEDFKRTWAQEVSLEVDDRKTIANPSISSVDASLAGNTIHRNISAPVVAGTLPDVPAPESGGEDLRDSNLTAAAGNEHPEPATEPLRKQDWL